ncbi:hypothetical protein K8P10_002295 [Leucobacter sp. Psy1]|uniref:hypothetical protein n=1 Tax=Leucobacter sp. Psy1 TaxID=2875729 RepID=UPI001CD50DAB|nr:hypothetical protein [Leucobacter sp. Psy1]UBH06784.1 hypothetical protein K8P10_002295 [Leucobacter sp. Psy1]
MSIGRYVTNPGVIGSAISVLGVIKRTKNMPADWRRLIVWGIWLGGFALSVAGVAKEEEDRVFEELNQ